MRSALFRGLKGCDNWSGRDSRPITHRVGASVAHYPPVQQHSAAVVSSKAYIIGGLRHYPSKKDELYPWSSIFCVDFKSKSFEMPSSVISEPLPSSFAAGCASVDETIYLYGGETKTGASESELSDQLFGLNVTTMAWFTVESGGSQPVARTGHAMCSVGNQLVLFGGYGLEPPPGILAEGSRWKPRRGARGWSSELATLQVHPLPGI